LLCDWCLPDSCQVVPDRCYRCYKQTQDSRVCESCRRSSSLRHVWVRTEYMGIAKQLIRAYKFGRARAAVQPIADMMLESLPYFKPNTVITHVPTATSRERLRGYDQSELIAKALSRQSGLHHVTLLTRRGQSRQVGATHEQRLTQLESAFRPLRSSLLQGAHVVLVDDIVTTGATLEAAARTLKLAGAKRVDGIVFAQKQ
jgi:ComF family protein